MDKKDMLMQLIRHYEDGNKTRFAKRLGLSPQGISTWLSRGTIDYELVYAKCEYLNAAWLLTGEGSMIIKDGVKQPRESVSASSDAVTMRLMDKLDQKEFKIDHLQSELCAMGEELATLKAKLSQYEPEAEVPNKKTKGLDHAKTVSTEKPSSLNADNATSAIAQ